MQPGTAGSEGTDLVVVDQRVDAQVTVVVVDGTDAGVVDRFVDPERAGTVLAGCGLVADRLIEIVTVLILVLEFRDPLGPGTVIRTLCVLTCSKIAVRFSTVEDEFEVVVEVLGKLRRRLEAVDETAGVTVRFGACQDKNRCFRHDGSTRSRDHKRECGRVQRTQIRRLRNHRRMNGRADRKRRPGLDPLKAVFSDRDPDRDRGCGRNRCRARHSE